MAFGSLSRRGQEPFDASIGWGRKAQLQVHRSAASPDRQNRDARRNLGRGVTERETERDIIRHAVVDRAEEVGSNRAQCAAARFLRIDDVSPTCERGFDFVRVSYAYEQQQLASPL